MQALQQQAYKAEVAFERKQEALKHAKQEEAARRKREQIRIQKELLEAAFDDEIDHVKCLLQEGEQYVQDVVCPFRGGSPVNLASAHATHKVNVRFHCDSESGWPSSQRGFPHRLEYSDILVTLQYHDKSRTQSRADNRAAICKDITLSSTYPLPIAAVQ